MNKKSYKESAAKRISTFSRLIITIFIAYIFVIVLNESLDLFKEEVRFRCGNPDGIIPAHPALAIAGLLLLVPILFFLIKNAQLLFSLYKDRGKDTKYSNKWFMRIWVQALVSCAILLAYGIGIVIITQNVFDSLCF